MFTNKFKGLLIASFATVVSGCSQDYGVKLLDPNEVENVELQSWRQTFETKAQPNKIDILFVIDNSGSMDRVQGNLADAFGGFISSFQSQNANLDFQVGVISTDTSVTMGSKLGTPTIVNGVPEYLDFKSNGPGSLVSYQNNERILKSQSFNFSDEEAVLALNTQFSQNAKIGIAGSGSEMGVQASILALSPEMLGAGKWNEGLVRDESMLSIVYVSDEDETRVEGSQSYLSPNSADWNSRLQEFEDAVLRVKNGSRGLVRVDSVVRPQNESCNLAKAVGTFYIQMASLYSGKVSSICGDFAANLNSLGSEISSQAANQFALNRKAQSAPSVYLNDEKLELGIDYLINAANTSVKLIGSALQTAQIPGAKIVLEYMIIKPQ